MNLAAALFAKDEEDEEEDKKEDDEKSSNEGDGMVGGNTNGAARRPSSDAPRAKLYLYLSREFEVMPLQTIFHTMMGVSFRISLSV